MKAIVDKNACIGCELCAQTCPDVFEMESDGLARAKVEVVPDELEGLAREAAEGCPTDAILISV